MYKYDRILAMFWHTDLTSFLMLCKAAHSNTSTNCLHIICLQDNDIAALEHARKVGSSSLLL